MAKTPEAVGAGAQAVGEPPAVAGKETCGPGARIDWTTPSFFVFFS
jgi:hypothetical protein